jgi:DnaJ-class molecular chaperone
MTWEAASDVLLAAAGVVGANMANPEIAERVYRAAAKRHHPDRGGDRARWDEIDEAWRVIKS